MKKNFNTYWMALILIVVLVAWLVTGDVQTLRAEAPAANGPKAEEALRVAYRQGVAERVQRQLPVQGQLEVWRQVVVQARISAVVDALVAEKGERVGAGELLIRLSKEDRPAQVAKAEAEVQLAQSELKGTMALAKRGLTAETDIKSKEAAVARAKAELAELQQQLADTDVEAPFAGVVETREVEIGQVVQAGKELLRLVDDSRLKMVGQVPQQMVASLSMGQQVTAVLLDGRRLQGELTYIAHQADAQTRSYRIEAALDNPERLRLAGSTATLMIDLGEVLAHAISPALLSLDKQGRLSVEHVGDAGRVVKTPVERVRTTPNEIWVTGLPETVRLITMGRGFVEPGTVVEAVEDRALKDSTREESVLKENARKQEAQPNG